MFAHALGCTVLAALVAIPAASDSGDLIHGERAAERRVVTISATVAAPTGQVAWDVEFPSQVMTVWFDKPTKVGDRILMGRYLIEHDNVRMARGRPCTYLYSAADPRLPVVAFRCLHLTRAVSTRPIVVLRSVTTAIGMRELVAFQFAGEAGAHGVPMAP